MHLPFIVYCSESVARDALLRMFFYTCWFAIYKVGGFLLLWLHCCLPDGRWKKRRGWKGTWRSVCFKQYIQLQSWQIQYTGGYSFRYFCPRVCTMDSLISTCMRSTWCCSPSNSHSTASGSLGSASATSFFGARRTASCSGLFTPRASQTGGRIRSWRRLPVCPCLVLRHHLLPRHLCCHLPSSRSR